MAGQTNMSALTGIAMGTASGLSTRNPRIQKGTANRNVSRKRRSGATSVGVSVTATDSVVAGAEGPGALSGAVRFDGAAGTAVPCAAGLGGPGVVDGVLSVPEDGVGQRPGSGATRRRAGSSRGGAGSAAAGGGPRSPSRGGRRSRTGPPCRLCPASGSGRGSRLLPCSGRLVRRRFGRGPGCATG